MTRAFKLGIAISSESKRSQRTVVHRLAFTLAPALVPWQQSRPLRIPRSSLQATSGTCMQAGHIVHSAASQPRVRPTPATTELHARHGYSYLLSCARQHRTRAIRARMALDRFEWQVTDQVKRDRAMPMNLPSQSIKRSSVAGGVHWRCTKASTT